MEFTTLKNGVRMPLEGFGVFQVPDAALCEQSVTYALSAGYRLIDTAAAYFNEAAVGAAIRKSGIPVKSCLLPRSCGFRTRDMHMQNRRLKPLWKTWVWITWTST